MQKTLKATIESVALVAIAITAVIAYHNVVKAADPLLGEGATMSQIEAVIPAATETSSVVSIPSYGYIWTGASDESELDFASLAGQAAIH